MSSKNLKSFLKIVAAPVIAMSILTASNVSFAAEKSVAKDITEARQESQIWTTYALSPYLRASDIKVSVHDGKATLVGNVEDDVNKDLAKEIALGVPGIKDVDNQLIVKDDYVASKSAGRSYGEAIDDATITAAVKSKLAWSKYSYGLGTKVTTKYGRVNLTGTVDNAAAKDAATRIAMGTRGVVSVSNQLTVDATKPTATDSAKSAAAETTKVLADSWITTKVKSTLLYSSNVVGSDIEVTTNNGVVTLSGKVASGAERALAIELAQNVRGVKTVNATALTF
jgi:osmotically-inducible protein OsmY